MPRDEVPLSLAVTPFANPETGTPVVRVSIDVGAFVRSDGAPVPLDIAILAVDSAGKQVASARQTSTVTARRPASGSPFTLDVQSLLPLPPGEFGVRVAVSDPGPARSAAFFRHQRPGLCRRALGVVGCQRRIRRRRQQRPRRHDAPKIHTHGAGARRPSDVSGHQRKPSRLASVSMRVRILDARGVAVHDRPLTYPAATFTKRRAGCVFVLPLAKLPAGEYLVRFDASAGGRTSGRTLRFSVE